MEELEPAPAEASDEIVARLARVRAERPEGDMAQSSPTPFHHPEWNTVWIGVAVAASVYPGIAILLSMGIGAAVSVVHAELPASSELLEMILVAGTVTIVGGASAACLAAIICVPAMFLVWGAIRLLRVGATWTTVGAISGGAVGFAGWLPVSYHTCQLVLLELVDGTWADWLPRRILLILLGPVLATLIGQVGGAYGGLVLQRAGFSFCPRDLNERPGRVSFSIGQLFSLTLVLSLALTALRMAGLLNAAMLLALACWLGLQVTLRRPAIWIAERVMRFLRRPKPRGYLIASGKPPESEGAVR